MPRVSYICLYLTLICVELRDEQDLNSNRWREFLHLGLVASRIHYSDVTARSKNVLWNGFWRISEAGVSTEYFLPLTETRACLVVSRSPYLFIYFLKKVHPENTNLEKKVETGAREWKCESERFQYSPGVYPNHPSWPTAGGSMCLSLFGCLGYQTPFLSLALSVQPLN